MSNLVKFEGKRPSFFKRRTTREWLAFISGIGLGILLFYCYQNPNIIFGFLQFHKICFETQSLQIILFSALVTAFSPLWKIIYHFVETATTHTQKLIVTFISCLLLALFVGLFFKFTGFDPKCSESMSTPSLNKEVPFGNNSQQKDILETKNETNKNKVNANSPKKEIKEYVLNEGFVVVGSKGNNGTIINNKFNCIDGEFTTKNIYGKKLVRSEKTISEVVPVFTKNLSQPIDSWDGEFSVIVTSDSILTNEDGWIFMKVKR